MAMTRVSYPQYRNYSEWLDDSGNKTYVNRKTGETHKAKIVEVECMEGGSIKVSTPEQVAAAEKYKELQDAENRKKVERHRNKEMSFYFALSEDRRDVLTPQSVARLFYLATYLHYNDDTLRHSDGTSIKKAELPKLMNLSGTTFKDFWREVDGKYLFKQQDKSVRISEDFFRGNITHLHMERSGENGYQQIYIQSLRELYLQTPVTSHRYLGYLFLLLPWVNWEFNVLCWNPQETEIDKIKIMTLREFCNMIRYDSNGGDNSSKLLDAYKHLVFTWKGRRQELCAYLTNRANGKNYFVVNPFVIYRGHDRRNVEVFGVFFQDNLPR